MLEEHADGIRTRRAELVKLDKPIRFVVRDVSDARPLAMMPIEYNDCLLTLINRTDPLYKSDFVNQLVRNELVEDVKANSLDIR